MIFENTFIRSDLFLRTEKIEKIKIIFQFTITLICALIIGALINSAFSTEFYISSEATVSAHFEKLFLKLSSPYEILSEILRYSNDDIIALTIVFAVSFAAFNCAATDILLVVCGARCGFTIGFLSVFLSNSALSYNLDILQFSVYATFRIAILSLILCYSYSAAIYSMKMRYRSSNGRFSIYFSKLLPFVCTTLAYVGAIIITNTVYCWLIYILK